MNKRLFAFFLKNWHYSRSYKMKETKLLVLIIQLKDSNFARNLSLNVITLLIINLTFIVILFNVK